MGSENTQAIDDVELHLDTGGLYALGKLEPGQSKSVRIFPRGEDGMQASFFSVPESKERTTPQMYIDASGGFRPKLTIGKAVQPNGASRMIFCGRIWMRGKDQGESMTITINLDPEKEARLRQKAAHSGRPVEQLVQDFVLRGVDEPEKEESIMAPTIEEPTLAELFAGRTGLVDSQGRYNYSDHTGKAYTESLLREADRKSKVQDDQP